MAEKRKGRTTTPKYDEVLMVRLPAKLKEQFCLACDVEMIRPSAQARAMVSAWVKAMAKEHPEIMETDRQGGGSDGFKRSL